MEYNAANRMAALLCSKLLHRRECKLHGGYRMRQGLRWRRWWPGSAGTASTDKARRWRLNGQRRQAPSRTGKRDYSLQIRGYEGLTSNSGVCSFEYRRTKWASRLADKNHPRRLLRRHELGSLYLSYRGSILSWRFRLLIFVESTDL